MIVASGWFSWTVRKRFLLRLPNILFGATLFCGLLVWSPFLKGQQESARLQGEQALRQQQIQQRQHAEDAAALDAISQHGLLAFTEPLHQAQEMELESYINGHTFPPQELIAASEHYQTFGIMIVLAGKPNCPTKALEVLLNHAIKEEKPPTPYGTLAQLYSLVVQNPNTTPGLLVKMLRSETPQRVLLHQTVRDCHLTKSWHI
jgi:hypothetical protein